MGAYWKLREIAEPERWNANMLADKAGLAYNTVHAIWTNQAKRADLKTLTALSRVLKIQPGDLIGYKDEEPPQE
jgi:DNA-binding Xre family transcriptional regulator